MNDPLKHTDHTWVAFVATVWNIIIEFTKLTVEGFLYLVRLFDYESLGIGCIFYCFNCRFENVIKTIVFLIHYSNEKTNFKADFIPWKLAWKTKNRHFLTTLIQKDIQDIEISFDVLLLGTNIYWILHASLLKSSTVITLSGIMYKIFMGREI